MPKKPLYKRLKYGNIFVAVVVIVFAVIMINVIKNNSSNNTEAENSSSAGDISIQTGNASSDNSGSFAEVTGVLGKINYTYVKFSKTAIYDGNLIVVNSTYQYNGIVPADIVSGYDYIFDSDRNKLCSIKNNEVKARAVTLIAINGMIKEFYDRFGKALVVLQNGYSTADKSDELATGLSVDFKVMNSDGSHSAFTPIGSYQSLADSAYKYGLIYRYPSAKAEETGVVDKSGYFRYVGQPHAQIMYKNDMTLEKYIEYLKGYSYENAIAYTTDDGTNYAVYYAASEGSETNIKIPTDSSGATYKYEISGNNIDGYIITVKLP